MSTTIVTALFDIGRNEWEDFTNSYDTYLYWMENTLKIDETLVIFTEEKFLPRILSSRLKIDPKQEKTVFVSTTLEELEAYKKWGGSVFSIMENTGFKDKIIFPRVPEMSKPWYNILMYNKVNWLKEASKLVESTHYMWLDAGSFRDSNVNLENWPKCKSDKNEFFSIAEPIKIEDIQYHALGQVRFIQGTCFVIPSEYIDNVLDRFNYYLYTNVLSKGLVCSDEKVFDFMYREDLDNLNICNWREYNQFFRDYTSDTIFIQIASYRDCELVATLKDLINCADDSSRLTFGITNQFHPDDEFMVEQIEYLDSIGANIHYLDVSIETSPGVCWARNKLQEFYNKEDYTLQLDSHMRFKKGWDTYFITELKKLKKNYEKPVLTTYAPSYDPITEERSDQIWILGFDRIIPEGVLFMVPVPVGEEDRPRHTRFYSAHCTFAPGSFCEEVPHDPEYYFHGEEISIAVRAFTHGYDLFCPHRTYVWHEYHRNYRKKVWGDDHNWSTKNTACHIRNRKLLGIDGTKNDIDFGKYGFGSIRSLADYEKFAGVNFKNRTIRKDTKDNAEPNSNSESEWINYFKEVYQINRHYYDKTDDLWILEAQDEIGRVLHSEYIFSDEITDIVNTDDPMHEIWIHASLPGLGRVRSLTFKRHNGEGWKEELTKTLPY